MRFALSQWVHSLAVQLLCTYVAALVLTAGFIVGAVWFDTTQGVAGERVLRGAADILHRSVRFDAAGAPGLAVSLPSHLSWIVREFPADVKYRVLDAAGAGLLSSANDGAAFAPPGRPFDSTLQSFMVASGGQRLFVKTESVRHGTQTYYLQVAVSERFAAFVAALTSRLQVLYTLRLALASLLPVTIAVYFTLRRVLKPLRETSGAAARIDADSISSRLSTRNLPVEFRPVVEAFNLTLDRLEQGYIVQRAFLAGAAHELKTPLAVIRAQIDIGGAADREVLLRDVDRMARQVSQLLHLAEASETQNYAFESVDVAAVTEDVADYLRPLAARREVYVETRCTAELVALQADRGALFMLLKNLLENAIQHSPAGGFVSIAIDSNQFSIHDEGPGFTADELPNLFKRFWRGATRRDEGAGAGSFHLRRDRRGA
jgi:two-component system sensor histidine kinase QseC